MSDVPLEGEHSSRDAEPAQPSDRFLPDASGPAVSEVEDYAVWLGMTLPEDDDLLWIAQEGLVAPLPEHWKMCNDADSGVYYYNFKTGESVREPRPQLAR